MKNFRNKIKMYTFGKVLSVGNVKTIGFIPIDNYYIDETTYRFGKPIKTSRYWGIENFKNRKSKKTENKRIVIKGFVLRNVD